jgi:hypothetical protein
MEVGAAAATLFLVSDGFSCGVVVVAELFLAEAGAGAAASVGKDVAALVLFRFFGGVLHVSLPMGTFFCKVFGRQEIGLDLVVWISLPSRLNAKARLLAGPVSIF